jgi:hypothetical protein
MPCRPHRHRYTYGNRKLTHLLPPGFEFLLLAFWAE